MSDTSAFGFGKFVPGFDFLQNLSKTAAQAAPAASTGAVPMLSVQPTGLHQRIGLVFGSRNEVERIERYHAEPQVFKDEANPLFTERSLFRD